MNAQLVHVPWDDVADQHLASAMGDDLAWLRDHVAAGRAVLAAVNVDGERAGSIVLRFELQAAGREAVIVAAGASKVWAGSLIPAVLPEIEAVVRGLGAHTVRAHSARRGFGRQLAAHGWAEAERIYRKVL